MTGIAPPGPPAWLDHRPGGWLDAAVELLATEAAVVRVTVASLRGSGPREPGASLVVARGTLRGTIGGGALEHRSIEAARALLDDASAASVRTIDYRLGPDLAQCCGGRVVVWIERLTAADRPQLEAARRLRDSAGSLVLETRVAAQAGVTRWMDAADAEEGPHDSGASFTDDGTTRRLVERQAGREPALWIFGAGHVGQAVLRLLAELPLYRVTWIDPRPQLLPATLPSHVRTLCTPDPVASVAELPANAQVLVLTHDHELDYALCASILARGDARWLGLIGSASKNARFRSRLRRDGLSPAQIARLTCPIGNPAVASKLPAAIAIGVVAQLLELGATAISAGTDAAATAADASSALPAAPAASSRATAATCEPGCGRCNLQPGTAG